MDRCSVVVHRCGGTTTLGALLDQFGAVFVAQNFGYKGLYIFDERGYDIYSKPRSCIAGVIRGRHWSHFTKDGRVKKQYKTKTRTIFKSLMMDFARIWHVQCRHIIACANVIKRYYRRYRGRLLRRCMRALVANNSDVMHDAITLEELHSPCTIRGDLQGGNVTVYNTSTLKRCKLYKERPLYYITDEHGVETLYSARYRVKTCSGLYIYKSPMTRREFTVNDIISFDPVLWADIARATCL